MINVRLVDNAGDYKKSVIKPSFVSHKIFNKSFVTIHEIKPFLTLVKPTYVGFRILALWKLLMYEFHYNHIKSKFSANLLFTYTESLVYEIKAEDLNNDFYEDKNLFDFSDYLLDSNIIDPGNKTFIGNVKDEFKGKIISEFVGLQSKMYSLLNANGKENKKSKCVNKIVVKNARHKKSVDALFNKKLIRHRMKRIQSKLDWIGSDEIMMFVKFLCFVLMTEDAY